MAKVTVEQQLDELRVLHAANPGAAAVPQLRKALSNRVNVVVAKAAGIIAEWQLRTLVPDLVNAFDRLLVNAAQADPQCWGKNALTKALKNLGYSESDLFLRGLKHRQWEASWGPKVDTAGVLRGTCALALVQCLDMPRHQILQNLVNAASEPEAAVRSDAVLALEQMGGDDVMLLLRLKARSGDQEPRVTGQVLESVLHLEGAPGIAFVAEFLRSSEEIAEEAALALGASRLPEAVDLLIQEYQRATSRNQQAVLLRAISASRQTSALDFLLSQVQTARMSVAASALVALQLHSDSEEIVSRVRAAVDGREEDLKAAFKTHFEA